MKGILINNEYCTGCHSCEVACKKYLELPEGKYGIKLSETGPFEYTDDESVRPADRWEWTYTPIVTKACNLCADRTAKGKMPMCVQHCQAWCMYFGELDDLIKRMDGKSRWALFTPLQD